MTGRDPPTAGAPSNRRSDAWINPAPTAGSPWQSARAAVSGKMDAAKNALSAAPNGHVQKATDAPSVSPKTVQVAKTDLDVAQLVAEASSSSSSSIRSSSSMEALETYTQPKLSAPAAPSRTAPSASLASYLATSAVQAG